MNSRQLNNTEIINKIEVLHSLPGRVRFGISKQHYDESVLFNIAFELKKHRYISEVQVSQISSNILIYFDGKHLTIRSLTNRISHFLNKSEVRSSEAQNIVSNKHDIITSPSYNNKTLFRISISALGFLLSIGRKKNAFARLLSPSTFCLYKLYSDDFNSAVSSIRENRKYDPGLIHSIAILIEIFSGQSKRMLLSSLFSELTKLTISYMLLYSKSKIRDILFCDYSNATRLNESGNREIKKNTQLSVDDRIVIKKGEIVAADSIVKHGDAEIILPPAFGIGKKQTVARGQKIQAGSTLVNGKVLAQVKDVGENTVIGQIRNTLSKNKNMMKIVELEGKKDRLKLTDLFQFALSLYFTKHIPFSLRVLTNGFSSNIPLLTNVTLSFANSFALNNGIMFKKWSDLLKLDASNKVFISDESVFYLPVYSVKQVISTLPDVEEHRVLELASSAEELCKHPIAKAIVKKSKNEALEIPKHLKHVEIKGMGVETVVNDVIVRSGNRELMKKNSVYLGRSERAVEKLAKNGLKIIYVSVDDKLIGVIGLFRHPAIDLTASASNRELVYLTGDKEQKDFLKNQFSATDSDPLNADIILEILLQKAEHVVSLNEKASNKQNKNNKTIRVSFAKPDIKTALTKSDIVVYDNQISSMEMLFNLAKTGSSLMRQNICLTIMGHFIYMMLTNMRMIKTGEIFYFHNALKLLAALNSGRILISGKH